MGVNDPRVRAGTSGTSPAQGRHYAANAATVGHVFTAQGDDVPPIWAPGGGAGVVPINRTLVVDSVNFSATPTGTFAAPFQTAQAAINYAVLQAWPQVQLLMAPGTYPGAISIPITLGVVFHGWDELAPPVLSGDITIAGDIGVWTSVVFTNCDITAATITSGNPANQDLDLTFKHTANAANILGNNVTLLYAHSSQSGNITASGLMWIIYDGWSWSEVVSYNPLIAPIDYNRLFSDDGHDVIPETLTTLGLAVGDVAFIDVPASVLLRAGDHASVRVDDPAIRDFICGVHGTTAGTITVWLRNLNRVVGDFNEPVQFVIHHNDMNWEPVP